MFAAGGPADVRPLPAVCFASIGPPAPNTEYPTKFVGVVTAEGVGEGTQVREGVPMLAEIFGVDGVVVVVVLAVLLFGGAAIPKLARNLGSAKHQFESGMAEGRKAPDTAVDVAPTPASPPAG